MNKKVVLIIGFIVLLILIIGLPFAVKLVQERQNLQKQAAVPGGSATISLSAASTAIVQGRIPVTISVKAPQSPNGITIIKTTLNITSTGDSPLVSVTASDIENPLSSSLTYYDPVINTSGSTITITLQAAYVKAGTSGFLGANDAFTNFAVINLLANAAGTVNINLDMSSSEIRDKNGNLDIMNDQAGGKSITIISDATPTATATPTTTTSLTGTVAPTATATPTTTANGTTAPTATATPTSTGRGGGALPTNTPTPIRIATATPTPIANTTDQVKLTSMTSGQTIPTSRPTFSGTATPNSTITITVKSDPITATVTTDASGRWTWTPTEDLGPGSHTVTITAVTPAGKTTTTTSSFTVGSLPVTGNISLTLILLGCGLLILLPVFMVLVKKAPIVN
jgi:hypothetical protein